MDTLLIATAAGFAVVNGINDGGTLLVLGLKLSAIRMATALLSLAAAVAVVPAVLGTGVATTLVARLVVIEGSAGQRALLVGVVAAVAVVTVLSRRGLPTSLTLALVGGLTGAGVGAGLPVAWGVVGVVLLTAAAAPAVGGMLAFLVTRRLAGLSAPGGSTRLMRRLHGGAFGLQCVAYGANDGQKMLAVAAIAAGLPTAGGIRPSAGLLAGIAGLFLLGSAVGVRRISGTVGAVIPVRPPHAVTAQASAAAAVLGSAAVGAPVSMTQAVAGGLIGAGVSEGYRRVRWKTALQLAAAWAITLPTALGAAAVGAWALR